MGYLKRMERLRVRKLAQTGEKLRKLGARDEDDYGQVLPPESFKVDLPAYDATGMFSGPREWAANFRWLMEHHPLYIDPDDALAGRWMFMLPRMREGFLLERANFAFAYSHLESLQRKYDVMAGIGVDAHFAPDYTIGLKLGWGGLKEKIGHSLREHQGDAEAEELLKAELEAIAGIQSWVRRLGEAAADRVLTEDDPERADNLREMAATCLKLVDEPPDSLREACQWLAFFNMASRTYNRDGAGGQLDELLRPYYEKDLAVGRTDRATAEFLVFCLLLNDPHYYQIGGPDAEGKDQTSEMSYMILDAAEKLNCSCNVTIRVWGGMDRRLFRRGVEILLRNRLGYPRFSGDRALIAGFVRNGFSVELARQRIAVGCNWMSLPGLEYTLNDVVKLNCAKVFEVAFRESHNLAELEENYRRHFKTAADTAMRGIDFHLAHQYRNEPELLLNLLSHGPIERGRDVSHGGATYYNMAIDGAGLATVADSFAALEQRVEDEKSLSWEEVADALERDFGGVEGERVRRILQTAEKFGQGNTRADRRAKWLTDVLAETLGGKKTPDGFRVIPGWFSWSHTVRFGKTVGATPDGRKAGEPISHGANPNPGFRRDGALTAAAKAVADIQPGWGNTAPWQLEVDLGLATDPDAVERLMALIEGHFDHGGTLVNINIVNAEEILDAERHPERHGDLIVRVTGFTAYFTSLSPEFRKLVTDRIIHEQI